MIEIPLTKGKVAIIDDSDAWVLEGNKWVAHSDGFNWYAERHPHKNGKRWCESLHRLISGASKGMSVDHIDGNGLNNCRNNLRICTVAENALNRRPRKGGASIYKGVGKKFSRGKFWKWSAYIQINGKRRNIGHFSTELEAAKAYNAAAIELHGQFARLNEV